jgi:DNA-binding XRE family transcriptional regulator
MRISPPSGRRSKITSARPRGRREGQRGKRGGMSEQLGLELRRIREERGLTVEELTEKSGISATTIRAAERGTREARGDTVAKLAKPLGLTFEEVWRLQRRRG